MMGLDCIKKKDVVLLKHDPSMAAVRSVVWLAQERVATMKYETLAAFCVILRLAPDQISLALEK